MKKTGQYGGIARRKSLLLSVLLCFCMPMVVNAKSGIDSLNKKQKGIANNIIASIGSKDAYYEFPKGTSEAEKNKIESAINKTYFQYYNGIIINFGQDKGTYVVSAFA